MIVVTTPTGNVGRHVLANLLKTDLHIRVITRSPENLEPAVRNRVEIVQGSHSDPAVVDRAFEGASALFWLAPGEPFRTPEEAYVDFARPAADAIKRHNVKRVVSTAALGRKTRWQDKAGIVSAMFRMDDLLMSTGVNFRALAMPSFMENTLHTFDTIRDQNTMYGPHMAHSRSPKTAVSDVGATAARLLASDNWSGQSELKLIGPDELSMIEMAAIVSQVTGREIPFVEVPYEVFRESAIARGVAPAFADGFVDMFRAKDEGMDCGPFHGEIERAPTTFRQWCESVLKPMLEI